jgi:VIT1/CCC1 family predicted Fe2+/Mn2+ transporter
MAAGEYISVQSQADTEKSDLAREQKELSEQPQAELAELAGIYQQRGLDPKLALLVAEQLTAHDALGAHSRDELGITEEQKARPIQASLASAAAFSAGAVIPIVAALTTSPELVTITTTITTLVTLMFLGAIAAFAGGAPVLVGAARVTFWGAVAMGITSGVGMIFGVAV